MNLQELSQQTGIPSSKLKIRASQLFGTAKDLTDEQISQLADNLSDASRIASLPPSTRQELVSDLSEEDGKDKEIIQTINTIGVRSLQKNHEAILRFESQLMNAAIQFKSKVDRLSNFMESYSNESTNNLYNKLAKDMQSVNEEFKVSRIDDALECVKQGDVKSVKKKLLGEKMFTDEEVEWMVLEMDLDIALGKF